MPTSDPTVPPAVRWLRWIAFGAAAALTASGEFELAQLAGWPYWVAWLLPVALDVYSYASFATRRRMDTMAALGLMIATNACYHLAATGIMPADWRLVVLVAALPPVICWRVHRLGEQPHRAHVPVVLGPEVPAVIAAPVPPVVPASPAPEVPAAEVPQQRKLHAVPARKSRPEVRADVRKRRPPEETRRLAEEIQAEHPELTKRAVAERLGISDRQLRAVLATA